MRSTWLLRLNNLSLLITLMNGLRALIRSCLSNMLVIRPVSERRPVLQDGTCGEFSGYINLKRSSSLWLRILRRAGKCSIRWSRIARRFTRAWVCGIVWLALFRERWTWRRHKNMIWRHGFRSRGRTKSWFRARIAQTIVSGAMEGGCCGCAKMIVESRRLEVRCGIKAKDQVRKVYVHMLNGTLCATERALCCLVENYQTPDVGFAFFNFYWGVWLTGRRQGVVVPEPLRPYMGGREFLPWVRALPRGLQKKVNV